ncbi:unnamed protein product [Arctia plantaginis]|uniref:Uncharacterized protein n=1 Tax=Arctia plantaginis TaxID=874455 RepID=A0A8S1ANX6_ARCPL|nr:unnamed protein product [Arctia plantaginis]CAB3249520.1 unnamed protein product [Arctia plantaginis]
MSAEGGDYSPCPAEALPELSAAELAMSLSPKSALLQQNLSQLQLQHSTPFSVTDILSPIEEYRKLELANNPPSPYRSNSSGSSINSPLGPSCGMATNPYAVPLYGGAPVQGYGCGPADLPHYGDMRGAGWYPASNDPRFANHFQNRSVSDCEHETSPTEQTPLTDVNKKSRYVPRYHAVILAKD